MNCRIPIVKGVVLGGFGSFFGWDGSVGAVGDEDLGGVVKKPY